MRLYIDTTDNQISLVRIKEHESRVILDSPRDQKLLEQIESLLSANNLSLKDLTEIEVNQGPGSFTGSRVGVAIANTLALALNLKVNKKMPPIDVVYEHEPNITKPKSPNK